MEHRDLESALTALGEILEDRGLAQELVAIGGGSLLLTGHIERPTADLDIVAVAEGTELLSARPLPKSLVEAVRAVATLLDLSSDWLNPGPTDLLELGLPDGFRGRTKAQRYGALVVHHAGRFDQICFKLYAAVDQGPRSKHFRDLQRLGPTAEELLGAAEWTRSHDPSDAFRDQLGQALQSLGVRDVDV